MVSGNKRDRYFFFYVFGYLGKCCVRYGCGNSRYLCFVLFNVGIN